MNKIIFIISLIFASLISFSQSDSKQDSLKKNEVDKDRIAKNADLDTDDGRTFTKAQVMPKFKNGVHALEDSLTNELLKSNYDFENKELILTFRIGKRGQITNINEFNSLKDDDKLRNAFIKTFGMWEPAKQNGYLVFAYKVIVLKINRNKITIEERN